MDAGAAAYSCLFLAVFPGCVLVCLYAWIHPGIAHNERMSDLPSSSAELFLAWQCSSLSNLNALYVCPGFLWVSHNGSDSTGRAFWFLLFLVESRKRVKRFRNFQWCLQVQISIAHAGAAIALCSRTIFINKKPAQNTLTIWDVFCRDSPWHTSMCAVRVGDQITPKAGF